MSLQVGKLNAILELENQKFMAAARQSETTLTKLGSSATAATGKITAGMAQAEQAVSRQAVAAQAAAAKQQASTQALIAAEQRLAQSRQGGSASAQQISRQESDVAVARARVATSSLGARDATDRLATAERAHAAASAQAEQGSNRLAGSMSKVKSIAAELGPAMSGVAVVSFFKNAVMAASDLEESMNAVDTIFGKSASTVYDFSAGASKSIGMSNLAAREAAATFGTYGKQANLAASENAKFSVEMATLAGDMASFKNTTPEQAIQALGAAFRGESDPIEQYGVLMNETILKNRAMKDGLISNTTDALSPAVRVQAAYNEVLAQTAYMQGDYEKTSGSLSNRLKTIKANFIDTSAAIGEKLLPAATAIVSLIQGPGMSAFSAMGTVVGSLGTAVSVLARFFGGLPGPVQAAIGAVVAIKLASMALGSELGGNLMAKARSAATAVGELATGQARSGIGTFRALGQAYGYAGGHAQGLGNKVRAAGTVGMSAFKTGAGSLMGFLGGPWGLAFAAAGMALGNFMQKQAQTKAFNEQIASSTEAVAKALNGSTGPTNALAQESAAAAVEQIKLKGETTSLGEALEKMGVSSKTAAEGLAGNGAAAKSVKDDLAALHESQLKTMSGWEQTKGYFKLLSSGEFGKLNRGDYDTEESKALEAYNASLEQIARTRESMKREAANGADIAWAKDGTGDLSAMASAMDDFEKSTDGASKRVDILAKALSGLRGDKFTLSDAEKAVNDSTRDLQEQAGTLSPEMVSHAGKIDTKTEAGSKADDSVRQFADDYDRLAAAMYTTTGSASAVVQAMQPVYDEFIRNATAMGMSETSAAALAKELGLLPTDVAAIVSVKGTENAKALTEALKGDISDFDGKSYSFTVSTLTDEARAQLKNLGFTIEDIPDGGFRVVPDTQSAVDALDGVRGKVDGLPPIKPIQVDTPGAEAVQAKLAEIAVAVHTDNNKNIVIDDNSPAAIARLADVGIKVQSLPDGSFVVTDNTDVTKERLNSLNGRNTSSTHTVYETRVQSLQRQGLSSDFIGPVYQAPTSADGNVFLGSAADGKLPSQALIKPGQGKGVFQWAEGETGGEAFIPLADSKRPRSLNILKDVASRFRMAVTPMADGGIVESTGNEAVDYARAHDGEPYVYGGLDCSGYQSGITSKFLGEDVRFTTDSDFSQYGFVRGYDPNGYSIGTNGGSGENGHMASTLYGTNTESRGGDGIIFGRDALGAQDFDSVWHLPSATRAGLQDGTEPAPRPLGPNKELSATFNDENDPDGLKAITEAGDFTGRFGKRYSVEEDSPLVDTLLDFRDETIGRRQKADAAKNGRLPDSAQIAGPEGSRGLVQWAEDKTGGEAYIPLAESKRPQSLAILTETARRMGMAVVSSEAAKVLKGDPKSLTKESDPTGWRALLGGDYDGQLRRYGIEEDHPAVSAILSIRNALANGDYDGVLHDFGIEEDNPIVDGMLGFNREVFGMGGIGGLTGDGDNTSQSWKVAQSNGSTASELSTKRRFSPLSRMAAQGYKTAALGAGLALTAASGFDSSGQFTGNFNTSNTAIPGLDKHLDQLTEIANKPTIVIEHAEIPDLRELATDAADDDGLTSRILQLGL